jgi:hypothetical protein
MPAAFRAAASASMRCCWRSASAREAGRLRRTSSFRTDPINRWPPGLRRLAGSRSESIWARPTNRSAPERNPSCCSTRSGSHPTSTRPCVRRRAPNRAQRGLRPFLGRHVRWQSTRKLRSAGVLEAVEDAVHVLDHRGGANGDPGPVGAGGVLRLGLAVACENGGASGRSGGVCRTADDVAFPFSSGINPRPSSRSKVPVECSSETASTNAAAASGAVTRGGE